MKRILLSLALLASGAWFAFATAHRTPAEPDYGPPDRLPRPVLELVEAVPFVTDEPFVHEWRAEKPLVSGGYLLVLRVDADLARPRQTYEAVLLAGDQTVERLNHPEDGEYLVGLVPAPVDAGGHVQLDLARTPIWFGSLELPERVDAARIAAEAELARARGIAAPRTARGARLRSTAGETLHVRTRDELSPYVADWVERYSPAETDLVAGLRLVGTR